MGFDPSMPHKKHQNYPPCKDQFHGVIENLPKQARLFFAMVAGTGGRTGTLMGVMKAVERIHCSYLNVYPEDVLRGTRGQPNYDPAYAEALAYGARTLGYKANPRQTKGSQP